MNRWTRFWLADLEPLGGRLRFGSPNLNFNIESSWARLEPQNGSERDDVFRYSVGTDINLAKDLWLTFNIGSEAGRDQGKEDLFALGNLKWALTPKPTITLN